MESISIRSIQTAALVDKQGGPVRFQHDYPVPQPASDEVLVKVLYSGVCQSDLHTKNGTAAGPTGDPITKIKLPHIGGHEGVGRVVRLGSAVQNESIELGSLIGIRFLSRICHECAYCKAGTEQYCRNATNHLHHEDGAFQQYIALPTDYVTLLPPDIDPIATGPTLCAGVTAYKAVLNASLQPEQTVVIVGAGGGLGHFAVQYAYALVPGVRVIAIDSGAQKEALCLEYGVHPGDFLDFKALSPQDLVGKVLAMTSDLGAHAVIVTSGSAAAYRLAADMVRPGGALCCCGIPPGRNYLETPVPGIVIRGLRIYGNLVGSLAETMEAVELVRRGKVRVEVSVRRFEELPTIYEELEEGDIAGRVVIKITEDE